MNEAQYLQQHYDVDTEEVECTPQVGDTVIIRADGFAIMSGILEAQKAGTPCVIREIEDDADFRLPYWIEAPNGDCEWMRRVDFDVVMAELSEAPNEQTRLAFVGLNIFEAQRQQLEAERDTLRQERDTLRQSNDTLRRHLHDLAMLEGTTDAGEHAERLTILREYE